MLALERTSLTRENKMRKNQKSVSPDCHDKHGQIGVSRVSKFSFSSESAIWLLRWRSCQKDQPLTMLVPTICYWFSIWLRFRFRFWLRHQALTYCGSETVPYCFPFAQFFVSTHVKESKHCQLGPFLSRLHNTSCQKGIIDLASVLSKR